MKFLAVLKQLCPRCRRGPVFSGVYRMHPECPKCGLNYEPEPGYFLGAMYFSYALGVAAAVPLCILLLWLGVHRDWIVAAVFLEMALLSPLLFSYARVMWMHLDQVVAPR